MNIVKRTIFLTLSILLSIAPMAHAQSSKASGFGSFDLQSAKKPWSYSRGKTSDGSRVERFELRSGDCAGTDCKHDRERIEFIQNRAPKQGTEVWVGYSVFLDSSWPKLGRKMYTKIGQWHLPKWKGKGQGPTLMMEMTDQCFSANVKDPRFADDDPMKPAPDLAKDCIASRSQMIGSWNRVVVNAKWTTESDGFLRIYLNDKLKWQHSGRTINRSIAPYFRYGLYRSFVSRCSGPCGTQIVYYKDVRQGKTKADVE
jgi:Polysaccharide lyase